MRELQLYVLVPCIHACTVCRLQSLVPKQNLLIASYDIVRNDIDYFV